MDQLPFYWHNPLSVAGFLFFRSGKISHSHPFYLQHKKSSRDLLSGKGPFQSHSFPGGRFLYRSPLTIETLPALLEGPKIPIHKSKRTTIERCILSPCEVELCLKKYLPRHKKRARQAFALGSMLKAWGISTPEVLGLIEEKRGGLFSGPSHLITAFARGFYELHWQIRQTFGHAKEGGTKRDFLLSLAHFLSGLYPLGLFHSDLSPQNVLVRPREEKWEFHLIDLEDVEFPSRFTASHLVKSLIQLGDLPKWITDRDKIYFFSHLLKKLPPDLAGEVLENKKDWLEKIQKGLEDRRQRRIHRDGDDWMRELKWIPGKGPVGEEVPYPTLPPGKGGDKLSIEI